jgi:hypothetical protein
MESIWYGGDKKVVKRKRKRKRKGQTLARN